jgi:hypothetical protein
MTPNQNRPFNRKLLRYALLRSRPTCEWPGCTAPATNMHELIPRNQTELNAAARDLSFAPEIVSMLCSQHHTETHDAGQEARKALLTVNVSRYGAEAVQNVFSLSKAVLHPND